MSFFPIRSNIVTAKLLRNKDYLLYDLIVDKYGIKIIFKSNNKHDYLVMK